jgi:hypothetical protein
LAEWLIERGIGEDRAILLHDGQVLAARLHWPEDLATGLVAQATLISRQAGSARGTARFPGGQQALVDRLPPSAAEGAPIRLEVTRPAMGDGVRAKLARSRPTEAAVRSAPHIAELVQADGHPVREVHAFPPGTWDEVIGEALAGEVAFPGGALLFSPTPAMLLIDVDGTLDPRRLALACVEPLAAALQRFDVGGSVGIDFPTLATKDERRAVDGALAQALARWPHERTAMNGFGFVQLVARLARPSLLHRATYQRRRFAAQLLLRRAEQLQGAGVVELAFNPALAAELPQSRCNDLMRRTGRDVRLRIDAGLAVDAPHAQLVPR